MFATFLAIVTFVGFFVFILFRLIYDVWAWFRNLNNHYRPLRYGLDYYYRTK